MGVRQVMVGTGELVRLGPALEHATTVVGTLKFAALLGSCSLMGVLLNFSMFLCTMHNR